MATSPRFTFEPSSAGKSDRAGKPANQHQIGAFFASFQTEAYLNRYAATLARGAFEPLLPGVPGYEHLVYGLELARFGVFNLKRVWDTMALSDAQKKGFQANPNEGLEKALARARLQIPAFRVPTPEVAEWRAALELLPDQGETGIRLSSFIRLMGGVAAVNRATAQMGVDRKAILELQQALAKIVMFIQNTPEVAVRAAAVLQNKQARQVQGGLDLGAIFGESAEEMERAAAGA